MVKEITNYPINFNKLINNSYSGITLLNNEHKVIYRSPSAQRITGWHTTDLSGHVMDFIVHHEDQLQVNSLLHVLTGNAGASEQCTFRLRHFEGHYIWVECTFTNMLDEPEINAIVCNFVDVTQKKAAEELLQKTLQELSAYKKALDESSVAAITDKKELELNRTQASRAAKKALEEKNTILESIGDGFFTLDRNWTFTYWNKMAAKALGLPKEKVLGKVIWQLFPAAKEAKSWIMYHEAMHTGRAVHFEEYYIPLNTWYEVSAYPSADGISVYFIDVTERVNYVKAIEAQNKKLTEISWIQSHLIRAPLSRIMGLVQLVQSVGFKAEESNDIINYLATSANELDEVIKNVIAKTQVDEE